MATLSEVQAELAAMAAQVEKNRLEVLAKIAELEAAAGDFETTPEFDAILADLKAKIQAADDDVAGEV